MTRTDRKTTHPVYRLARIAVALGAVLLAGPAAAQPAPVVSKEAGPIWHNADANNKCPAVCAPPARWNGQWRTSIPNRMSTCDCATPAP
jgi:hypothetical protein